MAYLAPIHRPSGIRHALKLTFLAPDEESLIVSKCNRLEIYQPTAEGLVLKHSKTLYGAVTILEKLQPTNSPTDQLFVGTDRYTYFVLSWDEVKKQLRTEKSYVDMSNRIERGSQSVERCMLDPTKQFLTLEIFEGILTVIPLFAGGKGKSVATWGLGEPIPSRIEERVIRSWTYLQQRQSGPKSKFRLPKMAMLFEDNAQKCRLSFKNMEFTRGGSGESDLADFLPEGQEGGLEVDPSSSHLIPVDAPSFGFLILAETSITYWNDVTMEKEQETLDEPTIWAAWTQVDECRWLLADDYGRLFFLMLVRNRNAADLPGLRLDKLGDITRPSTLVYLDGGYVFVGSNYGDSQVVKVHEGGLEIIQTLSVIAPITDFTVMDMGSRAGESQVNEYSSGQARIITGSGAFQDGSLRSVRSGVGLEDLGSLGGLRHVTNLFSLKSSLNQQYSDVLVASFVDETRIFTFDSEGSVEEAESFQGFNLGETTLLAQNLPQDRLLQCTKGQVLLIDAENGMNVATFEAQGESIVAASTDGRHLALSLGGVEVVILDLNADLQVITRKTYGAGQQISCLDVPDLISGICIIGSWQTADIALLKIDTLETVQAITVSEDESAVPRSILLTQLLPERPSTLIVALADGNVVTFDIDMASHNLTNRKSTILGTQEANLRAIPKDDGLFQVFATCEHPSVIYGSEGRIVFSAVTAEKASCICPFDAEAYPGAIAIASQDDLSIAMVDAERTTHVQTLHIGQVVRRIAYSARLKAFGLGTIKRTLREGVEIVQSFFKLADEVVFKELDEYPLKEEEIVESVMRADLDEGGGRLVERFVVGTAYIADDEQDAVRGRILVFEVTQDRLLNVVSEIAVKGACRALASMEGGIVAALMKNVVVYNFEYGSFNKVATFRTSTTPIDLAVSGDLIAVADIMKSISIVKYLPGQAGEADKIKEVGRHFQTAWSTATALVDEYTYLESDAEGNLTVLRQNINGVTADDKRRLEVTSEIRLGEMVNRIRPINVPASANAAVVPKAFMATAEGSLYLFGLIRPEKQDLLMRLQQSIASFVQSPGYVPFNKYRAFKNEVRESDEPFRFVDGELIENFLECTSAMQEEMCEGLGADAEETRSLVESLRRMH